MSYYLLTLTAHGGGGGGGGGGGSCCTASQRLALGLGLGLGFGIPLLALAVACAVCWASARRSARRRDALSRCMRSGLVVHALRALADRDPASVQAARDHLAGLRPGADPEAVQALSPRALGAELLRLEACVHGTTRAQMEGVADQLADYVIPPDGAQTSASARAKAVRALLARAQGDALV